MNFFDQVSSLIRAGGSLEDLGRGMARVLDQGHLLGFVLYGAPDRSVVAIPYQPPEANAQLLSIFEQSDWRGRPREAFLTVFAALGIPTGEIGEAIRWTFLGTEEDPVGVLACVRDLSAPPPPEPERKATDFFFRLASELAVRMVRVRRGEREALERDHLLDALNQVGRLMLKRPERRHLLPSLLKIALDVARTEVGSILLESGGRFSTAVEWGIPEELFEGIRLLPGDQGIVERVTHTLAPVIVDDFSGPTVRLPLGFPMRITSMVSIPLLAGDRLTGILNVATGEKGREMLLSTVTALTTVAVLIATAVENGRLGEALAARAEEAHQGRAEEQNILRRVLGSLEEGVLVSDPGGSIIMANPAAEEMLGLGGTAARRFPERNVVALRPFFSWLRERWSRNSKREEAEYRLAVSPAALLGVTITPRSQVAERLGHVTVIRDLTPGRAGVRSLQDGAARIASEMETPLAAARVALALSAPSGAGGLDTYGRIARRGLERLSSLAEDLRDYALLDAGRLEIRRSEFSLEEAVTAASADLASEMEEKRIAFQPPAGDGGGGAFRGDRERLTRALARLLGAVVRSCEESATIRTSLGGGEENALLSIEFLESLGGHELEPEADPGAEAAPEGGGDPGPVPLGLYLARKVVELHGGRVFFRSEEGREARLIVELPRGGSPGGNQGTGKGSQERSGTFGPQPTRLHG